MLIEGGYLHSLKALLEKADDDQTLPAGGGRRAPMDDEDATDARGLSASFRRWRTRLFRGRPDATP